MFEGDCHRQRPHRHRLMRKTITPGARRMGRRAGETQGAGHREGAASLPGVAAMEG